MDSQTAATGFTETLEVAGEHLPSTIARVLQSGAVTRLQLLSNSGNLTLVLPLAPAGDRVADRWVPVVETLARQHPALTLRIARG